MIAHLRRLVEPMYLAFMQATHADLARQIEYLRAENRILRKKLGTKLKVTKAERRTLLELGARVGPALRDLISIVAYDTFRRWMREARIPRPSARPGRPRKPQSLRDLVIRIGSETGWGYTRILGELKRSISHGDRPGVLRCDCGALGRVQQWQGQARARKLWHD
ncbi:MAG: hypothetical protein Q9O74_12190 [Planctomycetota bacterium]|nr:hypothetical protein [Planctomycetota bacterium]